MPPELRAWEERFQVFGQAFVMALRGPLGEPPRWEVSLATTDGERIFPQVVRGKSEDEARWRAEDVLRNWVAMRRLHAAAQRAADRATPGATIHLSERAAEVRVEIAGGWRLREPFRLERDEALDESRAEEDWETWVEAHLIEFGEPAAGGCPRAALAGGDRGQPPAAPEDDKPGTLESVPDARFGRGTRLCVYSSRFAFRIKNNCNS